MNAVIGRRSENIRYPGCSLPIYSYAPELKAYPDLIGKEKVSKKNVW